LWGDAIQRLLILVLLCCVWMLGGPCVGAQEPNPAATDGSSTQPASQGTGAPPPTRIVDRPENPSVPARIVQVPLAPFIGASKVLERGLLYSEDNRIPQRLTLRQSWLKKHNIFPQFGSLGAGSDTAVGLAYRNDDFLRRGIRFHVPTMVSFNAYQQYESLLSFPLNPGRWLRLEFAGLFRSRPEEPFHGQGSNSLEEERTSYFLQDRSAGAALATEWRDRFRLEFGFRYTNADVFRGRDDEVPSSEQLFPTLPGYDGASLLRYGLAARYVALDNPNDPRRGFYTRARFQWVESLRAEDFNFLDYGWEAAGYVPLGGPRTLALRLLTDFREPGRNGEVPFFVLPILGGADTLRGYRARRFQDTSALLITAEYRYRIWRLADFALFADHGQVAREPGDFSMGNFRGGYGAGLRLRNQSGVLLRFDVAHSTEGVRLHILFSPVF
jgi:outer membrane protein assembly factor BamA